MLSGKIPSVQKNQYSFIPLFVLLLSSIFLVVEISADELSVEEFANPGNEYQPRVWWHWMSGNVSKNGIDKDLKWMDRSGIGGITYFDISNHDPQIVSEPVKFASQQWQDMINFAVEKSESLGLEMTIPSSPGFSATGGPWVQEKDGMKKLVWSEVLIDEASSNSINLPQPPTVTGIFQSLPMLPSVADMLSGGVSSESAISVPTYYQDVAVVAYPVVSAALESAALIGSSAKGVFKTEALLDESLQTAVTVPLVSTGSTSPDNAVGFINYQYESGSSSIRVVRFYGYKFNSPKLNSIAVLNRSTFV